MLGTYITIKEANCEGLTLTSLQCSPLVFLLGHSSFPPPPQTRLYVSCTLKRDPWVDWVLPTCPASWLGASLWAADEGNHTGHLTGFLISQTVISSVVFVSLVQRKSVTIGLVTLSHLNVDVISMEPKIFEVPITSSWNVLMLKASQYPIANSIAHLNCKVFFIWTHIWDVAFNSTLKYLNHSLWVSLFMSFHIWGKSHGILMLSSHVAQGLCCAVSLSSNISLLSGRDTQCLLWLLLLSTTQLTQTHQVAREPYKELVPLTGSPETVLHRRWLDRIWFT